MRGNALRKEEKEALVFMLKCCVERVAGRLLNDTEDLRIPRERQRSSVQLTLLVFSTHLHTS